MSWGLVKRGLDLLCEDQEQEQQVSKSRKVERKVPSVKGSRHQREKRAAKQRKIVEQREQEVKDLFISSQKQVTSALEKYRQNAPTDRTSANLKLLKKIDKKQTPHEYVEQVLSQHTKQLERRGGSAKEATESQEGERKRKKKQKNEEASVFSEEDFEKMNKEWLKLY